MLSGVSKPLARFAANKARIAGTRYTSSLTPTLNKVEVINGIPRVPAGATHDEVIEMAVDYDASQNLKSESTAIFAGIGKLIKENGTIPFWGLLGATLIAKEFLLWNPVIALTINNGAVLFACYIYGSEAVSKAIREDKIDFINKNNAFYDAKAALTRATADIFRCKVSVPEVVTNTYHAFNEANEILAKARDLAARQAHVDATLASLKTIIAREADARRKRIQAAKDNTNQLIWDKINNDPTLKQAIMKEALAYVGNDSGKSFVVIDKLINEAIKGAARK